MPKQTLLLAALVAAGGLVVFLLTREPAAVKPVAETGDEWWEEPVGEILTEWLT
jgi:hypothetical protein